jgi:hypothetical protein
MKINTGEVGKKFLRYSLTGKTRKLIFSALCSGILIGALCLNRERTGAGARGMHS